MSRGPAHLDRFDLLRCSQSKMEPGIARRLVASPADPLRYLAPTTASNRDPGPDSVAIRSCTLQAEANEMAWLFRVVVQVNQWLILVEHDGIQTPVVIEVADRQTPTEVHFLKR